jgi:hypothetical protein
VTTLDTLRVCALETAAELFPAAEYPAFDFDARVWDFTRQGARSDRRIHFTQRGGTPMPPDVEIALKSMIVLEGLKVSNALTVRDGVRGLLVCMGERLSLRRPENVLSEIRQFDIDAVEPSLAEQFERGTKQVRVYGLARFIDWCVDEQLVEPSLLVAISDARDYADQLSPEQVQRRLERLPDRDVLHALGQLYRSCSHTADRLRLCAVGMQLLGGFRVGEVVSLPRECLKTEVGPDGRERSYILFWNEKATEHDRRQYRRRWLSPLGAELAKEFVSEIHDITAPWRSLAEVVDQYEDRVPLTGALADHAYLTKEEIAPLLGWRTGRSNLKQLRELYLRSMDGQRPEREVRPDKRPPGTEGRSGSAYPRDQVERMLSSRRKIMRGYRSPAGDEQRIVDTLLIAPQGFFSNQKAYSTVLVETLTEYQLQEFLSATAPSSVFRRYRVTGHDGNVLSTNTHAFRHWLNTVANKAGMSLLQITIWMGRTTEAHTLMYAHDPLDVADMARHSIEGDSIFGPRLERMRAERLSRSEREREASFVQTAHVASGNLCSLDFHMGFCLLGKHCFLDCEHQYFDPTNAAMVDRLRHEKSKRTMSLPVLRAADDPVSARQLLIAESELRRIDGYLESTTGARHD